MRPECIEILKNYIIQALIRHASNSSYNIFDGLVKLMQTNWDASPTTMAELRLNKKTKDKGDLLEHFAYLYFKHVYRLNKEKASEVFLLKDAPDDVLKELGLKRYDLGIDLLVRFDPDPMASKKAIVWCAVQVKYRQPNAYKQTYGVSWSDLSTFYALVNRSGPYRKHIVLTNSHYVRHIGKKEFKDQSICIGTLRNITKDEWVLMANLTNNMITQETTIPDSIQVSTSCVSSSPTFDSNSKDSTSTSSFSAVPSASSPSASSPSAFTASTVSSVSPPLDPSPSQTLDTSHLSVDTSPKGEKVLIKPIIRKGLPIISIRPQLRKKIPISSTEHPTQLVDAPVSTTRSKPTRPNMEELRKIRCAFYDKIYNPDTSPSGNGF